MSEFDNDLKIGDKITAYHKGFHQITLVERRFIDYYDIRCNDSLVLGTEKNSLIHYKQIFTEAGKPIKGAVRSCDAGYCQYYEISLIKRIKDAEEMLEQLRKLQDVR